MTAADAGWFRRGAAESLAVAAEEPRGSELEAVVRRFVGERLPVEQLALQQLVEVLLHGLAPAWMSTVTVRANGDSLVKPG